MRPDPQAGAMRDLAANLMQIDDVNRLIGEMTSGLSARYYLGSDLDEMGRLIGDKLIGHGNANILIYDGSGALLDAGPRGRLPSSLQPARREYVASPSIQSLRC